MSLFSSIEDMKAKILDGFKKDPETQKAVDPDTFTMIVQIVMALMPVLIAFGKEIIPILIKYIPQIIDAINKAKQGPTALALGNKISKITRSFFGKIMDEFNKTVA